MPKETKTKPGRPKSSKYKLEADDSKFLLKEFKFLHMKSVENVRDRGTPDINCVHGWIELKRVQDWPVRLDTPLRIAHFSPEQRRWLRDRSNAGGSAFVLLHVAKDWLLLEGAVGARIVGKASKEELVLSSVWTSFGGFERKTFVDALRGVS